ncbi:MAG: hypothetical protein K1X92_06495 [Bacteroidia bacterium]|nr:hypothetical protein [Bacteroidia bacterium]
MDENKIQRVGRFKCSGCGSLDVGYSAEEKKLKCNFCKNTWDIPKGSDKVVERRLGEGFRLEDLPSGLGLETKMCHCNSCGANTAFPANQVNTSCPFCGSTAVNEEAMDTKVIQPSGVLPFTFPQKMAFKAFEDWVKEGWFHPNDLQKMAELHKIQGVYLPFWTFDAFTESSWTADAGYYYYESESYTDAEGNTQTRQVQKVRWVPAGGYYDHFFDDVVVVASKGIPQDTIQQVFPFELKEVVNYDSQYLLGWECEVYQKDVKEGYQVADNIMDEYIRQECVKRIPGDTYRFLNVSTCKNELTFKHILLPIWIAAYRYNNKVYRFIVNGQTGKITGTKPYSAWKIAFTILAVAALIAIGVIIYQNTKQ